ncbi:MAG: RDD family protein [Gordonia sp. (in: high G+C Gram-positive bacteria)]|uniref:RDD family protein n=1 Tax=Gordonia sp. (in: high G+C Gram-positive bacteria) TaxID=84139 RepID=UPI0039E71898
MSRPVVPGPYPAPRPVLRPLPPPVNPAHSGTRGVGRDDFVSGEAVALDLPPGNIGLRILSGLIDCVLGWALFFFGILAFVRLLSSVRIDGALAGGLVILWSVIVFMLLPTAVETLTRGKTLGHWVCGLRTVNDDAAPITVRQAFARALVGIPEMYLSYGIPAVITAAINPKHKRLGDLVAGTYVIRDRASIPTANHAVMPPELAEWASTVDLAPLPPTLANSIRGYLLRFSTYTPQVQAVTGQNLVNHALRFVSPPPPPAPPERVLAAIAAERYSRDSARIGRDQKLRAALFG